MNHEQLVLQYLKEMPALVNLTQRDEFFNKFYELKEIYLEKVSTDLISSYKVLLGHSIDEFLSDQNKNIFVSAIISLSHNLVPPEDFDVELYDLFQACLELADSRTRANTLIALGEYDPQSPLFKDHVDSKSNRVAADALFVEAKKFYSDFVHQKIEQFLHSQNPFFVASAVYLVSQLAVHFYHTGGHDQWLRLSEYFDRIEKYTRHPHEMVRKRALQSLETIYSLRSAS